MRVSKISDQIKVVKSHTSVTHHQFFNMVMMAIKKKLEEQVPGLELQYNGKAVSGTRISAKLTGQAIDENGDTADKVRQTMDSLRNPATLLSALK